MLSLSLNLNEHSYDCVVVVLPLYYVVLWASRICGVQLWNRGLLKGN